MNALLVYCVNDDNFAGIVDASKNKQKALTNVQITDFGLMCVKVWFGGIITNTQHVIAIHR